MPMVEHNKRSRPRPQTLRPTITARVSQAAARWAAKPAVVAEFHGEQVPDTDHAQLDADDHDDEPAHDGREQAAQATQERCQGHLDCGGEQRHAEDRRQPAGLGGEERRPDIDRREDRCRQVAGAEGPRRMA